MLRMNIDEYLHFKNFKADFLGAHKDRYDERMYLLLGYIVAGGGTITDSNLLAYMNYLGIDFNNQEVMRIIHDILAYFTGAGVIEIKDTGLGIEISKEAKAYKTGKMVDPEKFRELILNTQRDYHSFIASLLDSSQEVL